ncbi:unnamed protein product, partial [Prorocentrum cordatum]
GHDWNHLAEDLQTAGTKLPMDLALAPVYRYVMNLHPHVYGRDDVPVDLAEHCSHDGFLYVLELGFDPTSYVYA